MVAAAVVGGAVIGGGASMYSANKAADAASDGTKQSAAAQQYMYDTTRKDYAPYRDVGKQALYQLAGLYGIQESPVNLREGQALVGASGGNPIPNYELYERDPVYRRAWDTAEREHVDWAGHGYTSKSDGDAITKRVTELMTQDPEYARENQNASAGEPDYSSFYNSPDYQFAYDQGLRSTKASLAARGMSDSGRAMKELTRFGQGLASQQLSNYKNSLASLAGIGQTSTSQLGALGQGAAVGIGNAYQNAADSRASGYLAQGNAIGNTVNQATTLYALNKGGYFG